MEQLSTPSETLLECHIEEAFHPYRPDNLSLLCMRNFDNVATTFCSIANIDIPLKIKNLLCEMRYVFQTDNNFQTGKFNELEPWSVLFGAYEAPYVCIDPAFMYAVSRDQEAASAVKYIYETINNKIEDVILQAGDFCFIDNYRVLHGRKSFKPRYDGKHRWLKRTLTTRDP